MFGDAFANLFETIRDLDGVAARYRRGDVTFPIMVARGQTTFSSADNRGTLTEIDTRDYFVKAAELVIASNPIEPQTGDAIEEILHGKWHRFEVLPDGGRSWRFADPDNTEYRIHTQFVLAYAIEP